jgi:hypothetical protein
MINSHHRSLADYIAGLPTERVFEMADALRVKNTAIQVRSALCATSLSVPLSLGGLAAAITYTRLPHLTRSINLYDIRPFSAVPPYPCNPEMCCQACHQLFQESRIDVLEYEKLLRTELLHLEDKARSEVRQQQRGRERGRSERAREERAKAEETRTAFRCSARFSKLLC